MSAVKGLFFLASDSPRSDPAEIVQIFETVLRNDISPCLTSIRAAPDAAERAKGGISAPVRPRCFHDSLY